ncbi:LGFP repeat-containing protein [Hoyosella altamirensis]|uniref:LGFP repeat-containing protein n=1 Tax=Hoyosella altamirensis TaxID=616997 RepID=A0A839RVY3_9ACTN|nr:hypothetical protein [Hoyosella altamirensis]MBB3040184.1 hypothetical protein [Hoyosella altamirensis]
MERETAAQEPSPNAEEAPPSVAEGDGLPYPERTDGTPTHSAERSSQGLPELRGTPRSESEAIPEGFTKADADLAERMAVAPMSGCQVYWPSPHQVCGAIRDRYNAMGGPSSWLSWPNSPEYTNPDGVGKRSQFLNGSIYWHPTTGAHPVSILYMTKWDQLGWETGWLGYPTAAEVGHGPLGSQQEFQGAGLFWSQPVGVYAVGGAIRAKYDSEGGPVAPGNLLGYPTTDEITLPDGQGRMNRFERGVIYWHPQHGAHAVSGTILLRWSSAGYEVGTYGYPVGDASQIDGIWFEQPFQSGSLIGVTVLNKDLYWPLTPAASLMEATVMQDDEDVPGENYESRLLPCMEYEISGDTRLALFQARNNNNLPVIVTLTCERFRTHMAPHPNLHPGRFSNYPPTRDDWYNFLACTFYTLNAEIFPHADPGNWGRQRGNTNSGVNSVAIASSATNHFVTGWAGNNEYSSQWAGCVQGLPVLWR